MVLGVLLGVWMATAPLVAGIADLFIAALYPLPKITLIPLLMIWFGTGGGFMLTISAMGAFFPVVINTLPRRPAMRPRTGAGGARPRRQPAAGGGAGV